LASLLLGFIVLWLALYAIKAFAHADPVRLARFVKRAGGGLVLLLGLVLAMRGHVEMAVLAGLVAIWLFGISLPKAARTFRFTAQRPSGVSRLRSAMIEMEFDRRTGIMQGTVLAGTEEGKSLDQMTWPQCEALYHLCVGNDPDGARLLQPYLDRRFAGWRSARQDESDPGFGDAGAAERVGAMSEDEAYEVLGLPRGASRTDVVRSHRSLMKKLHPDHGGSTNLAARVNEAKDVLMRRHH